MSAREYSAGLSRLRHLLERGPAPAPTGTFVAHVRSRVRDILLRTLKPYTYYAHEVDAAVLTCLAAFEREGRQRDRMETLAQDLIATIESLRRRIAHGERVTRAFETMRAEFNAEPYLADSPFVQFDSSMGKVTGYRTAKSVIAESAYTAFEDLFRGPAERVTELQRAYLTLVREHQPVLDVGCGRGEFLALLRSEEIEAHGIDSDPGMVQRSTARGLSAELADVGEYLDGLADASLGTIFSAQVIEHLPAATLGRFVEQSLRKLEPGGLFIAETVNPHSIQALKTFWVDLTHQHPIFPEVALSLCAIAGFSPAYVFAPGFEDFERAKFVATSYAVVATSPAG
jgi:2-polyprenyl-3-methyl-5-hydroxy-6-metoxy-1,4-benzoquinol methylase